MNAIASSFTAQLANVSCTFPNPFNDVKQNPQQELCAQLPIAF
jgi:hypothetical protein